jgi:anti-anti-sigma regulatory factor
MTTDEVVQLLEQDALKQLKAGGGEIILDLSTLARIDAKVAHALESLADRADGASVEIALSGVNVGVYRTLKLLKLTQRFSFVG